MPRTAGFTLVELMIVLVIVSVLLGIAIPGFQSARQNARVNSKANELLGGLQIARSESVARNAVVSVCPLDTTDSTLCAATGSFDDGWLVFEDTDRDRVRDAAEEILSAQTRPSENLIHNSTSARIMYRPDGTMAAYNSSGTQAPGAIYFLVCSGDYATRLYVEPTGRAYSERRDDCT